MEDRKQQLVFAWLAKGKNDLEAARLLIVEEKRLLDIGVYHCQQAAEKALKAWLTSRDIVFSKTHSLEDIVRLCVPSASGFSQFQHHAEELTPLAMATGILAMFRFLACNLHLGHWLWPKKYAIFASNSWV